MMRNRLLLPTPFRWHQAKTSKDKKRNGMNYKLDFKINLRKIIVALLMIIGIVPFVINSRNKSLINEWRTRYNIDDHHIFTQEIKRGMASFICYLLIESSEQIEVQLYLDDISPTTPTEQQFNDELQHILGHYKTYPNDFKLALIRLFKNSYTQSQTSGELDKALWQKSLKQYYKVIYAMLDDEHRSFNYGAAQDKALPKP